MTTIAIRDGVMACDSQVTEMGSDIRWKVATKIHVINGVVIGVAGDADARELLDYFRKRRIKRASTFRRKYPRFEGAYSAIVASRAVRYSASTRPARRASALSRAKAGIVEVSDPFIAVGSGTVAALAAMKAGASAERAVEIACDLDIYSCLPIHTQEVNL